VSPAEWLLDQASLPLHAALRLCAQLLSRLRFGRPFGRRNEQGARNSGERAEVHGRGGRNGNAKKAWYTQQKVQTRAATRMKHWSCDC
jgi:hypothetical protein